MLKDGSVLTDQADMAAPDWRTICDWAMSPAINQRGDGSHLEFALAMTYRADGQSVEQAADEKIFPAAHSIIATSGIPVAMMRGCLADGSRRPD